MRRNRKPQSPFVYDLGTIKDGKVTFTLEYKCEIDISNWGEEAIRSVFRGYAYEEAPNTTLMKFLLNYGVDNAGDNLDWKTVSVKDEKASQEVVDAFNRLKSRNDALAVEWNKAQQEKQKKEKADRLAELKAELASLES